MKNPVWQGTCLIALARRPRAAGAGSGQLCPTKPTVVLGDVAERLVDANGLHSHPSRGKTAGNVAFFEEASGSFPSTNAFPYGTRVSRGTGDRPDQLGSGLAATFARPADTGSFHPHPVHCGRAPTAQCDGTDLAAPPGVTGQARTVRRMTPTPAETQHRSGAAPSP